MTKWWYQLPVRGQDFWKLGGYLMCSMLQGCELKLSMIKEVVKVPVCIELEPDNPELHVPATELHPFPQKADIEPQ
jgi:hypothetical protein